MRLLRYCQKINRSGLSLGLGLGWGSETAGEVAVTLQGEGGGGSVQLEVSYWLHISLLEEIGFLSKLSWVTFTAFV